MQKTNYYKKAISGFSLDLVAVGRFYDLDIQKKLHRYKFVHNTVDHVYFETIFRELIDEIGLQTSDIVIVYPPVTLRDRIFRGPNHAKRLAQIFSQIIGGGTVCCPFQKKIFAGHQSQRNKTERKQVMSEYILKKSISNLPINKDIILIDDIITTGYTAHTLGELLRKKGYHSIKGFFLATGRAGDCF